MGTNTKFELYKEIDNKKYEYIVTISSDTVFEIEHSDWYNILIYPDIPSSSNIKLSIKGVLKSSNSASSLWIIFLIVGGALISLFCIFLIISKVFQRKYNERNQKRKVHAINYNILGFIQNQSKDVDEQSVSFDQVARYNNYLILNDNKEEKEVNGPSIAPNNGSSINLNPRLHFGNIIDSSKSISRIKRESDIKLLSSIGLIKNDD
mmetsp:Transcript_32382/g.28673  ORF Transcript_32382/g.28673 Transcript_32382/m.28673 type:complete len:207 (+) Transcript_32382:541-1161(+)